MLADKVGSGLWVKVKDWLGDGKIFQGLVLAALTKLVALVIQIQNQNSVLVERLDLVSRDLTKLQDNVLELNQIVAKSQVHNEYILARLDKLEGEEQ